LQQSNNELQDKLNSALNRISSLKSENENYLLLIQELSKADEPKESTADEVKINILLKFFHFDLDFLEISIN
jgi:hypothetical protein